MSEVEPIRKKSDIKKIGEYLFQNSFRDFLIFKIGINCGLRISDILALNVKDVKNKNYIQLIEKKTTKKRKIPLNKMLKNLIKIYVKNKSEKEPLFLGTLTKKRIDRIAVYRVLKRACYFTQVDANIGTHTLRKTFGYHYYKKYKDIVMLQKIFNHSSPSITLRYIGFSQDEIYKSYINFTL